MPSPPDLPFCLLYHERTKYTPETLARRVRQLDWAAQPSPFKEYTTGESLDLRPYLPGQSGADQEGELRQISRLLYLTYGITAVIPYPDRPFYLRSSPSAGGLYPAEVYVICRGQDELPAGIYNYQVRSHSLVRFWNQEVWNALTEACFGDPAFGGQNLAVVVTAVFERSAWRYEDRAYRRVFLDSGHLLGNLELAAGLEDLHVSLITGFSDGLLDELLFLIPEEEGVVAVAVLGETLAVPPGHATALPSARRTDYPSIPDGQLLAYLHGASSLVAHPGGQSTPTSSSADKYNFPFCAKLSMATEGIAWKAGLEEAIVRRRSTRQYTGEDLTLDELKMLLDFTYQPQHYADQGFDPAPEYAQLYLLSTFVAVLGVLGLEAGCYYYAPQAQELRQIRFKNFRREIYHLCLGQDLGRDSAAVIFHTADLPGAAALYGERVYRTLHLDSGHLAQRLNLAAVHLGIGVSGIGGFYDDQVNEILGIPEAEAVLYLTTLGHSPQGQSR